MSRKDWDRAKCAETLSYWFLRLNGFLTTENFIVHPDQEDNDGERTDADIVGVRFQHRDEQGMTDFPLFSSTCPYVVLVEATSARKCKINGPWSNLDSANMQRVLRAFGFFPNEEVDLAAAAIYKTLRYKGSNAPFIEVQYIALACETDERMARQYPALVQITWSEVLSFIHRRFNDYHSQKEDHHQWRADGKQLWDSAIAAKEDPDGFVERWLARLAAPKSC